MSSRLFQNVREKRGLAYSVFSGLSAYRDAGNLTIYAGCASEAVEEVVDLCVAELRTLKQAPIPDAELRRAKDHLKGSLMLSLENTASRMSHLARQEIYFGRHFGLDETLSGVERCHRRRRAARRRGSVLQRCARRHGPRPRAPRPHPGAARPGLTMIRRYTNPEMGSIWSEQRRYETGSRWSSRPPTPWPRPASSRADAARELRATRGLRRRPHRRDRADDAARRHRVHDGRRRESRARGALAALRPDVLGRRRHRAGAADAAGVRSHRQEHRGGRWTRCARAPRNTAARR